MVEDIVFDALLKKVDQSQSLIEVADSDITISSQVVLENINAAIYLLDDPPSLLLQAIKLNAYFENFSMHNHMKKEMPDLDSRDFIFNVYDYIKSEDIKYFDEVTKHLDYLKTSFENIIIREKVELISLVSERTFSFLEEFFNDDLLTELEDVAGVTKTTLKKWQREAAPRNYNFAPVQLLATCFYFLREEGMTNEEIIDWYNSTINNTKVKDLMFESKYWLEIDLVNYFEKKGVRLKFFVADFI
jgi:hypothetical protein